MYFVRPSYTDRTQIVVRTKCRLRT
jgi:hypothetical protein